MEFPLWVSRTPGAQSVSSSVRPFPLRHCDRLEQIFSVRELQSWSEDFSKFLVRSANSRHEPSHFRLQAFLLLSIRQLLWLDVKRLGGMRIVTCERIVRVL